MASRFTIGHIFASILIHRAVILMNNLTLRYMNFRSCRFFFPKSLDMKCIERNDVGLFYSLRRKRTTIWVPIASYTDGWGTFDAFSASRTGHPSVRHMSEGC